MRVSEPPGLLKTCCVLHIYQHMPYLVAILDHTHVGQYLLGFLGYLEIFKDILRYPGLFLNVPSPRIPVP